MRLRRERERMEKEEEGTGDGEERRGRGNRWGGEKRKMEAKRGKDKECRERLLK